MSVAKGTRLGQYEVREPIGEGGMGEVYRGYLEFICSMAVRLE